MKPLWFKSYTPEDFKERYPNTLLATLGIRLTEIGPDYVRGTMPVDARTHQPQGLLHGGASVALAETLGSIAANLVVDPASHLCVGQEINANHLRGVTSGAVTGTARPYYIGRTSQVWGIEIVNEQGQLVCISRITMAVKALK
ncbi:MAG: hotdog fold thioesterase [Rhodospirillaceae bacterium]